MHRAGRVSHVGLHRTSATPFGRRAAPRPATLGHLITDQQQTWRIEYLEGRTLFSQLRRRHFDDSGLGSLRQAIIDADDTLRNDTIASRQRHIDLAGTLPDLGTNMTSRAPGPPTDPAAGHPSYYRIFTVPSSETVTLSGLTISQEAGSYIFERPSGCAEHFQQSAPLTVNNAHHQRRLERWQATA